ncbi:MAG: hypothetical protein GTN53_31660, partial [Candidatus Aminicenantes bacterium]|nr:hypothetical protein [Candidatus Aminicenantes bacterium]
MEKEFSFVTEALSNSYIQCYPGEAAQELTQLAVEDIKTFLKNRPPHHVTAIVEHLPLEVASDVIEEADESFVKKTLSKLDPLRVGMILARLDADQQKKTLACLDPKRAGLIKTIMTYPLDSAGGIMNPQFLGMLPDSTVGEVLLKLRSLKKQKVSEIVVQDPKGHIQGLVPLQQLVAAPQTQSLATLYHGRPITVHVMASRQDVVDVMEKTKINTLPVVDLEDRVFGVIQQDTLFETAQEEASADIQMMVGVSKEERALSKVSF